MSGPSTTRPHGAEGERARELAEWCLRHMVARTTAYGRYTARGKSYSEKKELTLDVLARHFAGEITIGVYVIGTDNMCRFVAFDIDNHDKSKEEAVSNKGKAIVLLKKLRALGAKPIFEDSDGRGSYHVWVIFDRPVEAWRAYAWARSVALPGMEVFPKQPRINPKPGARGHFGNFIRLPGKHHKRDHWSRFEDGGKWWDWNDGIDLLLDCEFFDADLVPEVPEPTTRGQGERQSGSDGSSPDGLEGMRDVVIDDVLLALACLRKMDPRLADNYQTWLKVGMALHHVDPRAEMLAAWTAWSRHSSKYESGACEAKWPSFGDGHSRPVTLGTLIHLAGDDPSAYFAERIEKAKDEEPPNDESSVDRRTQLLEYLGHMLGRSVDRWIKLAGEKPVYTLVVADPPEEITIGDAATVRSFRRFTNRLYDHGIFVKPQVQSHWPAVTRALLALVEEVDNPDGGRDARVFGAIEEYLSAATVHPEAEWHECFARNDPFVRKGELHIHVPTMRKWLARRFDDHWPRELLYNDLHQIGFRPASVAHRSWRTSRWYRAIPLDLVGDRWAHLNLEGDSEEGGE